MKKAVIIMAIISCANIINNASGGITKEQAGKLVAAVWKSPPLSMDVTYCVTFEDHTKTEQELREIYEKAYDQTHGPKEKLSPYLLKDRETMVQENVNNFLKDLQKEGGRKATYRIRFDGNCLRVDRADIWCCSKTNLADSNSWESVLPGQTPDPNIPFQFSSVEVMNQNGTVERFEYSHEGKSVTRRIINAKEKQDVMQAPITGFMMIPRAFAIKKMMSTSRNELSEGPYEIDVAKIDQLCSSTLKGVNIVISPDENAPTTKEKIVMDFYAKDSNKPISKSILVCAKEDYSKVYYNEVRNAVTNRLLLTRACSDFDSQGFPHNVIEIKYDNEGKVKSRESYQIQDVHINIPIPKETFAFNPPADYQIMETDANGIGRVIREKGCTDEPMFILAKAIKAKDVGKVKELLGHKIWQVRLESLRALEQLLVQDKKELKDAATMLENDENQSVREQAEKILHRIKATELKDSSGKQ
jgi:hypothetical protein